MEMTLQAAKEIMNEMIKYASETKPGRPSSFALVDRAGVLVAFERMDGAAPLTARMAINKAHTAIDWGIDTKVLRESYFAGEAKRDVAWFGDPRLAPIPGGVLLKSEEGTILGAIGSSGRTGEEDEELAQVGAKVWNTL